MIMKWLGKLIYDIVEKIYNKSRSLWLKKFQPIKNERLLKREQQRNINAEISSKVNNYETI